MNFPITMDVAAGHPRTKFLNEPIDPASVIPFRIAFGLLIAWESWRYFNHHWIELLYLKPRFLFTYPGLDWIAPWPGIGLHLHFFAIGLFGLAIAAGLWYRASCVLLCLALAYVVLLDKAAYLNHLYLAAIFAGLMAFVPANVAGSIDARRQPELNARPLRRWCLWLLRFQTALPYIFGGFAKLNPDWLAGQPMGLWLSRMTPYIPFLEAPTAGLWISYAAMLFDLCVIPALLWRPTRPAALTVAIVFHLLNAAMFRIGIFPWMMIAATTLFLSPNWPRRFIPATRTGGELSENRSRISMIQGRQSDACQSPPNRWIIAGVTLWISLQLLLPLRHLLYPGRADWNERGSRFAWRMMVRDKASVLQFVAVNPETGQSQAIDPRTLLTTTQIERMGQYPDMLRQFAAFLADALQTPGSPPPEIHVTCLVSFNGRKPQHLIDPTVNLAGPPSDAIWVEPLAEPLPDEPWLVPMRDWARVLGRGKSDE